MKLAVEIEVPNGITAYTCELCNDIVLIVISPAEVDMDEWREKMKLHRQRKHPEEKV